MHLETPPSTSTDKGIRVLRLLLTANATSAPYNQFSLALVGRHRISICSYFESRVVRHPDMQHYQGNGTLRGFFRVLHEALRTRAYDIIHAHSPHVGCFLVAYCLVRRRSLRSTVFTVHSSYPNYRLRNRLLLIPVFMFFRRVICCSRSSFDSFPRFFKWLAGSRLSVIQNGVDIERVDRTIRNAWQSQRADQFTIVTVGRLIDIKHPLSLLKAFQSLADADARLVYIGDGDLREDLVRETHAAGLEQRIEFTGLIPRESVYERLAASHLFVSGSEVEGLPVAAMEAMASGCPAVLSDIPPHREIAADADFIPLIPIDDVAGFAGAIRRFMEMSASERQAIGEKCRRLVVERFSLATMHDNYERAYHALMDRSIPPRSRSEIE